MKKLNCKKYLGVLVFLLFMSVSTTQAQPGFPEFNDDVDDEAPDAPVDGFIGIAFAFGAYFGAQKFQNKKK